MWAWVPLLAVVAALLGIAERYHARFVPDVEKQKRQLKAFAYWSWTGFVFVIQVVGIVLAARQKGSVTSADVVRIAFVVGIALFWLYSVFALHFARLFGRHLSSFGRLIDVSSRLSAQLSEVVQILSEAPGIDENTRHRLVAALEARLPVPKAEMRRTR